MSGGDYCQAACLLLEAFKMHNVKTNNKGISEDLHDIVYYFRASVTADFFLMQS